MRGIGFSMPRSVLKGGKCYVLPWRPSRIKVFSLLRDERRFHASRSPLLGIAD